ncbi:hypothetical protein [Rhodovulum sp. BSW8]|uniref:hypothetical protein n=1 Tax=Rhodovulum sp. BSW8 TaxID=2259645 RepID=UPI0014024BCB|nr:hypothetical protein [Rhodovulum sp. BSW8]
MSRFANVVLFAGSPDQTLSARAYAEAVLGAGDGRWDWRYRAINATFQPLSAIWPSQSDHCRWAWEEEVSRAMETLKQNDALDRSMGS